jgi:hypothetical protein
VQELRLPKTPEPRSRTASRSSACRRNPSTYDTPGRRARTANVRHAGPSTSHSCPFLQTTVYRARRGHRSPARYRGPVAVPGPRAVTPAGGSQRPLDLDGTGGDDVVKRPEPLVGLHVVQHRVRVHLGEAMPVCPLERCPIRPRPDSQPARLPVAPQPIERRYIPIPRPAFGAPTTGPVAIAAKSRARAARRTST